jgi:hypothetical protein
MEAKFNRILRDIPLRKSLSECVPEETTSLEEQFNQFAKLYPYYLKKAFASFGSDQITLSKVFKEAIDISLRFLYQTSYRFSFEKGGMYETRYFSLQREKEILLEFPEIYYPISILLNELLIRPVMSDFHEPTLILIRRLFHTFPDLKNRLVRPILVLLTNITLFGKEEVKKQAAIFLYQLIHQEKNQLVIDLVSQAPKDEHSSNHTRYLRRLLQAAGGAQNPQNLQRAGDGLLQRYRQYHRF